MIMDNERTIEQGREKDKENESKNNERDEKKQNSTAHITSK